MKNLSATRDKRFPAKKTGNLSNSGRKKPKIVFLSVKRVMRNRRHTRGLKATRTPRTRRMLRQDLGGTRELSSWPDLPAQGGKLRAADWSGERPCKASEQLDRANRQGQAAAAKSLQSCPTLCDPTRTGKVCIFLLFFSRHLWDFC